jgi:hypothetical protein
LSGRELIHRVGARPSLALTQFQSVPRGPKASDARAFLTFDWDKPNWRAIRVGVIPALKAARTAFN